MVSVALPYVAKLKGPKVLIGDNLSSHPSPLVVKQCQEQEINFVLLPPNATHLCQPLHVAWFKSIKGASKTVLAEWKFKHRGNVPKTYFPRLLWAAMSQVGERLRANAIAGFRACGICPLDSAPLLKRLPRDETKDTDTESLAGRGWCQALLAHLKALRAPDPAGSPATATKRGKPTPGTRVTCA